MHLTAGFNWWWFMHCCCWGQTLSAKRHNVLLLLPTQTKPSTSHRLTTGQKRQFSKTMTDGTYTLYVRAEQRHQSVLVPLFHLTWYNLWIWCLTKEAFRTWPSDVPTTISSPISGGPFCRQSWLWKRGKTVHVYEMLFNALKLWVFWWIFTQKELNLLTISICDCI